jgi:serine/threonine-protein kinase RsbW
MVTAPDSKLKISSKTENLNLVEKMINNVCSQYSINEDNYGNILIALTEAVNNAIYHGNKSDPDKMVEIAFEPNGKNSFVFTVKDEGKGFEYNSLPDPTDPDRIDQPNGRGVFLMRNLADKVEFFDGGRTVAMSFNLKSDKSEN